jgi:hypothetical protein
MRVCYIIACALAAVVPLLPLRVSGTPQPAFPGWLTRFEGKPLKELPLSEREQRFKADFSGHIARFTDGTREIVVRWVTQETRKLHPTADCFEGLGYRIKPLPLRVDAEGNRWGAFAATRGDATIHVYERIHDDAGNSWTEASEWYWAALMGKTKGPWWAITVAEP